jgi:hypothetical protein
MSWSKRPGRSSAGSMISGLQQQHHQQQHTFVALHSALGPCLEKDLYWRLKIPAAVRKK